MSKINICTPCSIYYMADPFCEITNNREEQTIFMGMSGDSIFNKNPDACYCNIFRVSIIFNYIIKIQIQNMNSAMFAIT